MAAKKIPAPHISEAVIRYLEAVFPSEAPTDPNLTQGEVGQLVGRQDVVRHLQRVHRSQNESDH